VKLHGVLLALLCLFVVACASDGHAVVPEDLTPSADLTLRAKNSKFDKKALAAPPATEVRLTLDNQDTAALHNFALYDSKHLNEKLFAGELFTGKKTVEYRFTTPAAGSYYFRCDAHPDMNGTFVVKPAAG
jgi:plastocyanin